MHVILKKETLQFLKDLKKRNEREWFNENKERFVAAQENMTDFTQGLIVAISKFDRTVSGLRAKDCLFRIYRDVRFSKDKSPYKTNFGAGIMGKGKEYTVPGYYLHIEPGDCFLAGGIHLPDAPKLKLLRKEISANGNAFLKIIRDKDFKRYFILYGEKLSKVPQGFDKEDPMAEYLKFKEYTVIYRPDDKKITSAGFLDHCAEVYKAMLPFNRFLKDALD